MSIIAHFSDLHLIERDHRKRPRLAHRRLRLISYRSTLDAEARIQRVAGMLEKARGADHILITGDLTEDGVAGQFEVLAEVLHNSGISPDRITLVPGNHDGYTGFGAWDRALSGPLRAFQGADHTVLPDALIIPVSTMIEGQLFLRSRGVVRHEDVLRVRGLAVSEEHQQRAIVVAQHHPPSHHALGAIEWIDGVLNALSMRSLLVEQPRIHVLHGHGHIKTTKHLSGREHAQIYSTSSVRDQYGEDGSLRFYAPENGLLRELPNGSV
jgi:3',5'-cyclic AMP phosphodiesterase CpdA